MKLTFTDYDRIKETMAKLHSRVIADLPRYLTKEIYAAIPAKRHSNEILSAIAEFLCYTEVHNGKNRFELYLSRHGHKLDPFEKELLTRIAQAQYRLYKFKEKAEEPHCVSITDIIENRLFLVKDVVGAPVLAAAPPDQFSAAFFVDCDQFLSAISSHCFSVAFLNTPELAGPIEEFHSAQDAAQQRVAQRKMASVIDHQIRAGYSN